MVFKLGDKVRLVKGGGDKPLYKFKNNGVYTIMGEEKIINEITKFIIYDHDKENYGYANKEQLDKVNKDS